MVVVGSGDDGSGSAVDGRAMTMEEWPPYVRERLGWRRLSQEASPDPDLATPKGPRYSTWPSMVVERATEHLYVESAT